jgi:hypothetical protein
MIKQAFAKHFSLFWHPKVKELKRRAARSKKHLQPIQNHTSRIKPNDRLLIAVGKNENSRVPYFLEYYRKLGIDHFLFVDNMSNPPMADVLSGQPDVSLWRTEQDYADAGYGVDWVNALLARHAISHWVLYVDLDEFFVYPLMESRSYDELLDFHDDIEKPCMSAIQVDMYPDGDITSIHVPVGESPLSYAPFFDRDGYHQSKGNDLETCVRGGPRFRMLQEKDLAAAPLLSKTPLIRWRARFAYYKRNHVAYPPSLNTAYQKFPLPTGALLHFKLISPAYQNHLKCTEMKSLCGSMSTRFENSQSLVGANLITPGGWK